MGQTEILQNDICISSRQDIHCADAHEIKTRRKQQRNFIRKMDMQDLFEQQPNKIDERIFMLQDTVDAYKKEIIELDMMLDILKGGDINADSRAGRGRRNILKILAKGKIIDIEHSMRADETIDHKTLRSNISEQYAETMIDRDEALDQLRKIRQSALTVHG